MSKLVVKHNNLIEAKSKFHFSLMEQKIFTAAIAKIKKNETAELKKSYRVDILEIFPQDQYSHIGKKHKELFIAAGNKLLDKKLFLRDINDNSTFGCSLISGFSLPDDDKKSVEISFYYKLKPYLFELSGKFTSYQLKNILKMHSSYSIRIYELLKQFESAGHREILVDDIRSMLALNDKYNRFYDFEKYVLQKSKEEINKYSDIKIDYKKIKKGRRINKLKYTIRRQNSKVVANPKDQQKEKSKPENKEKISELINLSKHPITEKDISVVMKKTSCSFEELKKKIQQMNHVKNVKTAVGLLTDSISNAYDISPNKAKNSFHDFQKNEKKYTEEELNDMLIKN